MDIKEEREIGWESIHWEARQMLFVPGDAAPAGQHTIRCTYMQSEAAAVNKYRYPSVRQQVTRGKKELSTLLMGTRVRL